MAGYFVAIQVETCETFGKLRWAGHAARVVEKVMHAVYLQDLEVDGRRI